MPNSMYRAGAKGIKKMRTKRRAYRSRVRAMNPNAKRVGPIRKAATRKRLTKRRKAIL